MKKRIKETIFLLAALATICTAFWGGRKYEQHIQIKTKNTGIICENIIARNLELDQSTENTTNNYYEILKE